MAGSGTVFLLIGLGYLARWLVILRAGDERALNALVYYFALPAFLVVNISAAEFTSQAAVFMAAGLAPVATLLAAYLVMRVLGAKRDLVYLLAAATAFGSLAFFGVPYVEYVLGTGEPARLAALVVTGVAPLTVGLILVLLELYQLRDAPARWAARRVVGRLARNPLILAIAGGTILSLAQAELPTVVDRALVHLSSVTTPVALFSLGVFLFGRTYRGLCTALGLSALRLLLIPAATLLTVAALGLPPLEGTVLVLMNGSPMAVNMIVLSSRYRFLQEEMATTVLLSSLGSLLTLSLWAYLLDAIS
ncbi:MAG: AEC family transporter [Candidatus Bipolaricaulaceae bacterium]